MTKIQVKLSTVVYPSISEAYETLNNKKEKLELGADIKCEVLIKDLSCMFNARDEKKDQLGQRKIVHWTTVQSSRFGTKCFAAKLDDGSFLELGLKESIKHIAKGGKS